LLARINRQLGATFDLDAFDHRAVFQLAERRVQMSLVSRVAQRVRVGEHVFELGAGEQIVTEHCYKHTVERFHALASAAGLHPAAVLEDPDRNMAMYELRVAQLTAPSA
jgi:uncharacterized SAM-dependent methyltransferase